VSERFEPAIYSDMSFETYLNLDAWGSSALRAMRRGPPARVRWEKDKPHSDTSATLLGSAVHCGLLTPHLFADTYVGKPEGMKFSTKDGKAWRDSHQGRKILSTGDFALVGSIIDALNLKPVVAASLENSAREHSIIWTCPASGETCKGRPDWIDEDSGSIYDLKVTRHGGTRWMAMRAYSEGWMHQLAHYRTGAIVNGAEVSRGRLVVVEPEPPHFVWTLEVKRDALDLLELENGETLKQLRDCRVANAWPGTPDEWTKIEPPAGVTDGLEDVQYIEPQQEQESESDA
jgi:hypothetical protein